jgi:Kelch motif
MSPGEPHGMSPQRRNGLLRLAILIGSGIALIVLGVNVVSGSGGGSSATTTAGTRPTAPSRLVAAYSRARLPIPLHGLAVTRSLQGLVAIGGADRSDVSQDSVYLLSPAGDSVKSAGSLTQPLHDAAAASVNRQTMVFGGGNTSTLNAVQVLTPGGKATQVGHLPAALSDLSAVHVGAAAYLIGGFDGMRPNGSVLQTTDGRAFTRVARLPTAVRYAAVAALPDKIYVFGGELGSGQDTDEIQEYDIATERSVVAGHLPAPVSHASAITLDGTIFLLGGRVGGSGTDRIYRFDPTSNLVTPAGRLPQPVYDGAAGALDNRAYLIGGIGRSGTSLASVIALH